MKINLHRVDQLSCHPLLGWLYLDLLRKVWNVARLPDLVRIVERQHDEGVGLGTDRNHMLAISKGYLAEGHFAFPPERPAECPDRHHLDPGRPLLHRSARRILDITGLSEAFPVFDTVKEAIAALR